MYPFVEKFFHYAFIQGNKKFPSIYNFLYQKTRNDNAASAILKKSNLIGIHRVQRLIEEEKPSVIVCTCPAAAGAVSILKKLYSIDIPAVTVITDHTVHSYWIYPHIETYVVGSEDVRQGLLKLGIDNSYIHVTGIPISPKFSRHHQRQTLKKKHGMSEGLPVILVTGGGLGIIGNNGAALKKIDALPLDFQLILVCGHNKRLYQQVQQQTLHLKHRVLLTQYVDYMDELMAISDMMITKAGGLTISEGLAMRLPMLLYKPLGGQELDNVHYLLKNNTALLAENEDDLCHKVVQMLTHQYLLEALRNNMQKYQRQTAVFDAVKVIQSTVNVNKR